MASPVAQTACNTRGCVFDPWDRKIPWRREWQPTPVFLPGESHGQRNLTSFSPWGCKESGTNEQLTHTLVVQWLRLCTSTAGGMGWIPSRRANILHAKVWSKKKKVLNQIHRQYIHLKKENNITQFPKGTTSLKGISPMWIPSEPSFPSSCPL